MVPAPQCSGYSLIDRTIHPWTDSQRFSNAPRAESTFLYRWTSLYAEVHRRYIDWPPDLEFARSFVDVAGATRDVRIVAPQRGSRGTPEGAGHTRSTQCNPKSRCIQQMTRAHKIFLHFETPRVNVGLLEHSIVTRSFSNGRIVFVFLLYPNLKTCPLWKCIKVSAASSSTWHYVFTPFYKILWWSILCSFERRGDSQLCR